MSTKYVGKILTCAEKEGQEEVRGQKTEATGQRAENRGLDFEHARP